MRVSRFRRGLCLFFAVLVLMASMATPAFADDTTTGAETSFYKLSSVASAWFADSMARPTGVSTLDSLFPVNKAGNVGGLLGYADEIDDSGLIQGWIASALSASSATISYSSFGEGTSDVSKALTHYVNYGRILRLYGFDGMATEGGNILRTVAGGIIKIAYWMSLSVEFIFNGVVQLLQIMNPFRFIMPPEGRYQIPQTQNGVGGTYEFYYEDASGGALYELAKFLGNMYSTFQEFGTTFMIPILFFILVTSILLSKDNGTVKHKILIYARRVVIIFLGVPMCTSIYTTMLNSLAMDISSNQAAAQRIILSTFLDFESWAEAMQLRMPTSMSASGRDTATGWVWMDTKTGSIGGSSIPHMRDTCYAINVASWKARGFFGSGGVSWSEGDTMNTGSGGLGSALQYATDTLPSTTSTSGTKLSDGSVTQIGNLLDRYMGNECYHSGDFESYVKSKIRESGSSDTTYKLLTESPPTKVSEFKDHVDDYFSSSNELWSNGGSLSTQDTSRATTLIYSHANGLSTMSMYNYLSTKFDASSMTVYSNEKASSGLVRPSHLSVNLVGTTIVDKILNWVRALMLLVTVSVIGWFYGFSMIMSSVRRSIMTIVHIPFMALGGLRSTARVVLQVTLMIIEVVATVIAYRIMAEIALSLDNLFGNVFLVAFRNAGGITIVTGAVWNIFTILLIVVNVLFLLVSLKLRKSIVKSFDEQAKEFIDKIFGVNSGPTGNEGPGLGTKLAGAAAAGAGAGLAHKMMGGQGGSGNVKGVEKGDQPGGPGGGPGGGQDDKSKSESDEERQALAGEDARALPPGGESGGSDDDSGSGGGGGGGPEFDSGDGGDASESGEFRSQVDAAESLDDIGSETAGGAPGASAAAAGDDADGEGESKGEGEGASGAGDESGESGGADSGSEAGDGPEDARSPEAGDAAGGSDPGGDAGAGLESGESSSRDGDEGGGESERDAKASDEAGSEARRDGAGSSSGDGTTSRGARAAEASKSASGRRGASSTGDGRKFGSGGARKAGAGTGGKSATGKPKSSSGSSASGSGASKDGASGAKPVAPAESDAARRTSSGDARGASQTSQDKGLPAMAKSGSVEEAKARRDALAAQLAAMTGEGGAKGGPGGTSGSDSAKPVAPGGDSGSAKSAGSGAGKSGPDGSSAALGGRSSEATTGGSGSGSSDSVREAARPDASGGDSAGGSRGVETGAVSGGPETGETAPEAEVRGARPEGRSPEGSGGAPGSSAKTGSSSSGTTGSGASGETGAPSGGFESSESAPERRETRADGTRAGAGGVPLDSGRGRGTTGSASPGGSGQSGSGSRTGGESSGSSASAGGKTSSGSTSSEAGKAGSSESSGSDRGSRVSASRIAMMTAASTLLSSSDSTILQGAGSGIGMATQAGMYASYRNDEKPATESGGGSTSGSGGSEGRSEARPSGGARSGGSRSGTGRTAPRRRQPQFGSGGGSSSRTAEPVDVRPERGTLDESATIESYDAEAEELAMRIENLRRKQEEERERESDARSAGRVRPPKKSLKDRDDRR